MQQEHKHLPDTPC